MCVVLVACAALVISCSRAAQPLSNPSCDPARTQGLIDRGYAMLNGGQWYQAHLAGHALVSIGQSCDRADIAAPAAIHGAYLLSSVFAHVRDANQERQYVTMGMSLLGQVKAHESDTPGFSALYDQMMPKFDELQAQLR